jgi:hypothetical protein
MGRRKPTRAAAPVSRKRALIVGLGAAAVIAILAAVFHVRAGARRADAAQPSLPELPQPRGGVRPVPSFVGSSGGAGVPGGDLGGPGPHFAHYEGRSGRLAAGVSPGAAEEPATRFGAPGDDPALEVWVPSIRVLPRGTSVFARLTSRGGEPLVVSAARVGYAANHRELPVPVETMTAVKQARDSVELEHHFTPPTEAAQTGDSGRRTPPPRFFRYQITVTGTRAGVPFERRAGGIFYVHDPGARLLAATAELAPEGGDLRLRIKAAVARAGTYFVYAELWGGPGRAELPVAFARERLAGLTPGEQMLELRFGGRIIHDSAINGPYVVRNLRLQQVDTHPAHEDDPIAELPPSADYPVDTFH